MDVALCFYKWDWVGWIHLGGMRNRAPYEDKNKKRENLSHCPLLTTHPVAERQEPDFLHVANPDLLNLLGCRPHGILNSFEEDEPHMRDRVGLLARAAQLEEHGLTDLVFSVSHWGISLTDYVKDFKQGILRVLHHCQNCGQTINRGSV